MIVYLDFDDFNTEVLSREALEAIDWLMFYFPKFKVNMLVSYGLTIPENKYPDKIAYLLHGWKHDHFDELTTEQLDNWPYDKIYRAPYWELSLPMYRKLVQSGYKILLKADDPKEGIKYNWDIREKPDLTKEILHGHGHVTPSPNFIVDCIDNILCLPRDTEFRFIRDMP